jgi:hypothetical protein
VAVALDDDTGSATDVLVAVAGAAAVAVAVDVAVAAPASAVAARALVVDSAFNMSVTCTKKNPSTTGNSLDSREFSVL